MRVFWSSGIVNRPSDRLYVRTILLYWCMDRRSCYTRIYCLSFTVLFATHLSFGFSLKQFSINVSNYTLYHCRADYMHPYMARNTNIYNNFWPFSYLSLFLWSRLIWHIIPMNVTHNSNKNLLSFGISSCKYAPGMSKVAPSLPLNASITSMVIKPSSNAVVGATLSPSFKYLFCLLPFSQVIPLMILFIFPLWGSKPLVLASFMRV